MCSEREVLALVSSIYDASLDPGQWPEFLRKLCKNIGATSGLLMQHGALYPTGEVVAVANIDVSFQLAYARDFGRKNVWLAAAHTAQQDHARTSEMMMPVSELVKTEFYRNFLRPQNVLHTVGACIKADPCSSPFCIMFRSEREGPFGPADMNLLTSLTPHLRRAFELQHRMARAQVQSAAGLALLDITPIGCLLVDHQSRVLAANRAAEGMLQARDGLETIGGVLSASRPDQGQRLRQMVDSAGLTIEGRGMGSGGAMTLERPSTRPSLHVLVVPYRGDPDWSSQRPAAIIFVSDPERELCPDRSVLASLFGLTPGESRVAAALLNGRSIEECARELAISRHTARNHLKAIFSKTETTRQGELVRLLLSSVTRLETRV